MKHSNSSSFVKALFPKDRYTFYATDGTWSNYNLYNTLLKIHGPRVNITNENWKQLQALDFANTFHKVISKYREMEVFAALKYYLTGISIQSFESLYEYYPSWMKNKITTIYGISDCAKK